MTQFYTYLHCKPDGTPFYVGKGNGRRAYRVSFSKRNLHHQNIVNKYGVENIKVYVFNCDSETQAFSDEIQQIKQLMNCGFVLANRTNGGEGPSGLVFSEKSRIQMSISQKGRTHSNETKLKMSLASKGKRKSELHCKHVSDSCKGRVAWNKGIPLPSEQKEKISNSKKGKISPKKGKKGIPHTLETREKMSASRKLYLLAETIRRLA